MHKTNQAGTDYYVIGVMSGSSLDGLDVCLTKFNREERWNFSIEASETFEIPESLRLRLKKADQLPAADLFELDVAYGEWIGSALKSWSSKINSPIELIGVHGHTVFHEPSKGFSIQIGSGSKISLITQLPVVDDFRTKDILLGGQGAPLVPFGEHHLFPNIKIFINLGGIANISFHEEKISAWDIAPCNQVLNHFAQQLGYPFDFNGELAASGTIDADWQSHLNTLNYFHQAPPKSLSNQWTKEVLKNTPSNPIDALRTYVEFLAEQISDTLNNISEGDQVMISGGGAFNKFLIDTINNKIIQRAQIIVPQKELVEYKEALIFGFLALQKKLGLVNIFSSSTGSRRDTVGGTLHLPD